MRHLVRATRSLSTASANPLPTARDYRLQHKTSQAFAVIVPLALLGPQSLHGALDGLLTVLVPVHMAVGLRGVVTDYVPSGLQGPALAAVYLAAGVSAFGMAKLSSGDGMLNSVKELWAPGKYVKKQ